ncbi:replication factor A/ankyrin repeat domain-containing protein [Bodo saltans virus]|uniref:Replication factor A/ankyrin repeat domain-containing protein n=1 Tax=Bodo saltans virus TaxID=2024608 RepID=A0A2H4UT35_9VIRU|nr:replication factor A/ankyrin repeat domain-containing protein [Bodo saltans virus]ATZ80111.1 replication factor A/ankyrin repeat domain-containing protein [Bodo saltans virus]
MLTDWIIHTQLYDNLKIEKSLDNAKLNSIIEKIIEFPFKDCLNDLIIDEKIEILYDNPKIGKIFELIEFNEEKIVSIRNKFINLSIRNNFEFNDLYKNKDGKLYDFYENILKTTCFGTKHKCKNCHIAAKKGHLGCLKYVCNNGCSWDSDTCAYAALNNNLECLKYVHENGCHWNSVTCRYAAEKGNLECLKYAHENGCPWNEDTCVYAARHGHLECLKYAHENGCFWDERTCENAALNGHLECLKYAHENDCPWNSNTCYYAARNGQLKCLKYAHENGCPWDENACASAAINKYLECFKYAYENGCKWKCDEYDKLKNKYGDDLLKYVCETVV